MCPPPLLVPSLLLFRPITILLYIDLHPNHSKYIIHCHHFLLITMNITGPPLYTLIKECLTQVFVLLTKDTKANKPPIFPSWQWPTNPNSIKVIIDFICSDKTHDTGLSPLIT